MYKVIVKVIMLAVGVYLVIVEVVGLLHASHLPHAQYDVDTSHMGNHFASGAATSALVNTGTS